MGNLSHGRRVQTQPATDDQARFVHALLGFTGEQLHANGIAEGGGQLLAYLLQRLHLLATAKLVGLGQQRMRWQPALHGVAQHLPVVVLERVTDVHHHHQATQRLAGTEILVDERLPVRLQFQRNLGIPIAGQIHQTRLGRDLEENQLLGTAGGLGDAGQGIAAGQRIECAGLACVGAAGKRDFGPVIRRQLPAGVGGKQVTGIFKKL